ncbi:hypothetical protein PybrP1_012340 [[Pythium] brassicae (nom. inval.)]|nr:hypothetical protein PybrP1_012340 [[Pythium] brassicae (nom. inval.)]
MMERGEEGAVLVEAAVDALGELDASLIHLQRPLRSSSPIPVSPAAERLINPATDDTPSSASSYATTASSALDASQEPAKSKTHTKEALERRAMSRTALLKELEALEFIIKLHERKLAALSSIRATAMANEDKYAASDAENSPGDSRFLSAQHFEDSIERRLEAVAASAAQELTSPTAALERAFEALFVPKSVLPVRQHVVDLKMMKLRASAHEELLVVALDDGAITFHLSSGKLLLRIEATTERRVVRAVELDLHGEVPTLAVLYSEPPVAAVYALSLTEGDRHLMGSLNDKRHAVQATTATPKYSSSPDADYVLTVTEVSAILLASEPMALAFAKTSRRGVLTVATADGSLQFFAPNGTLLHEVATNASIHALATQRGRVAFARGSDTVLFPLARGRSSTLVICPGSAAAVTSVSFDPDRPELLYVGTSLGELLVYAIEDSVHASSRDPDTRGCTLEARALVKGTVSSSPVFTAVRAMRGFVIAASDTIVSVHNVSRSRDGTVTIATVCTTSAAPPVPVPLALKDERDQRAPRAVQPIVLAVSEGAFVTNIAFVGSTATAGPTSSDVRVFQSLLSNRLDKSDTSWVGVLFFGAIFVAVLGCQFFLHRQKQPGRDDPWNLSGASHSLRGAAVGSDSPSRSPRAAGSRDKEQSERFGSHGHNFESLSQEVKAAMASRTARVARASVGGGKGRGAPISDRERFGPSYDALSEDLKRKIAEARRDTLECSFDSDEDDSF